MKLVCLFLSVQNIRAQLEELDTQTQCIDDHVTRLEGVTPSGEDEVHTHPHQGFIQREGAWNFLPQASIPPLPRNLENLY